MPDIREVLRGLDPEDAKLYSQVRLEMRRSYLAAHAQTLDIASWHLQDDMILDYIDIVIAQLFDRSGRFNAMAQGAKEPDVATKEKIEAILTHSADSVSQRFLAQVAEEAKGIPTKIDWPNKENSAKKK